MVTYYKCYHMLFFLIVYSVEVLLVKGLLPLLKDDFFFLFFILYLCNVGYGCAMLLRGESREFIMNSTMSD